MFVRLVLIVMLAISPSVLNSNPVQSDTETEQHKTETEQRWWEKREERKPDIYFPHNIHLEALKKEGDVCALCHSFQKIGETDLELIKEMTVVINEPLKAMCHDCHVVEQRAPWRCSICHTDKTAIWPADHNFNYVQHHGSVARKDEQACRECHIELSFCSDCHFRRETSGIGYHPLGYITLHGMEARFMPGNCGRCHNNRYCEDCHERRR